MVFQQCPLTSSAASYASSYDMSTLCRAFLMHRQVQDETQKGTDLASSSNTGVQTVHYLLRRSILSPSTFERISRSQRSHVFER